MDLCDLSGRKFRVPAGQIARTQCKLNPADADGGNQGDANFWHKETSSNPVTGFQSVKLLHVERIGAGGPEVIPSNFGVSKTARR